MGFIASFLVATFPNLPGNHQRLPAAASRGGGDGAADWGTNRAPIAAFRSGLMGCCQRVMPASTPMSAVATGGDARKGRGHPRVETRARHLPRGLPANAAQLRSRLTDRTLPRDTVAVEGMRVSASSGAFGTIIDSLLYCKRSL